MYNLGNELYKLLPKSASLDVCRGVGAFIATEFERRTPKYVRLILHGGEPMLMPPAQFEKRLITIFAALRERVSEQDLCRVQLALQTNATLVTDAWIELLERWNISVGVSIDGPESVHDRRRLDRRGRGSYHAVVAGLSSLQEAAVRGRIKTPGVLCVIDPEAYGEEVYGFLTAGLKVEAIDFLMPFTNWDSYSEAEVLGVGSFLSTAFVAWVRDRERGRRIKVRVFDKAISSLRSPPEAVNEKLPMSLPHYVVVVAK